MGRKFFLSIVIFFLTLSLEAQQIELFNINLQDYPVVRANFTLTDSIGDFVFNIHKDSVQLIENNQQCKIQYFRSPAEFEKPVSIVLVFDVSGSMQGNRLEIARTSAKAFIDEVSLMYSEVAVLSFNQNAFVNTDFTHDYNRLMYALSTLNPGGGTSYNNSFLENGIGIFDIAKHANYKTHVVFLTDGLSTAKTDTIIQLANQQDITVYTTSIGLKMPDELKEISQKTGGDYFEEINNQAVGKTIYKNLYREIQAANFGTVRWLANISCHDNQLIHFSMNGVDYAEKYKIPKSYIGRLAVFPDVVVFDSLNKPWPLQVGVDNYELTVTDLRYIKSGQNATINKNLPLNIKANLFEWVNIDPPKNTSGLYMDRLRIVAGDCDSVEINVLGGHQPKVILHHPKGGEVFGINTQIPIRWGGVSKYKDVDIRIKSETSDWQNLGTFSGFEQLWNGSADTGKYKINIRPTSNFDLTEKVRIDKIKEPVKSVQVSPNGEQILSYDTRGNVYLFNTIDGNQDYSFFKYTSPIIFSDSSKQTIAFSGGTVSINQIETAQTSTLNLNPRNILVQAFRASNGIEMYKPFDIQQISIGERTLYDPVYGYKASLKPVGNPEFVCLDNTGNYLFYLQGIKELNVYDRITDETVAEIKLPKEFTKIIISPNGETYAIISEKQISYGNWKQAEKIYKIKSQKYEFFSPAGTFLVTRDYKGDFIMWDTQTGKAIIGYNRPASFILSPDDSKLFVYQNEQFIYHGIFRKKTGELKLSHISRFVPLLKGFQFSADSKYFAFVTDDVIEFYDATKPIKELAKLKEKGLGFNGVQFRNYENEIITQNADNTISIWTPKVSTREAESGWFYLVKPQLKIKSPVDFGIVELGTSKEVLVNNFLTNNNAFPVRVDSVSISNNAFRVISSMNNPLIENGDSLPVEIRFRPTITAKTVGTITVFANDTLYTSNLTGEAFESQVNQLQKSIHLGDVLVGSKKDSLVPVFVNEGSSALQINQVEWTGLDTSSFSFSMPGNSLPPGDTLSISCAFKAVQRGLSMQQLALQCQTKDSLLQFDNTISLTGNGIAPSYLIVYGRVYNQHKAPIAANVTCTDVEAKRRFKVDTIHANEFFSFRIYPERPYGLFAGSAGYFSSSEFINPKNYAVTTDSIRKDLYLTKIEKGAVIRSGLIFFEVDKADLLPTSIKELDRIFKLLKENKELQIEIHGHTDSDGSEAWNLDLSKRRAESVRNYLIGKGIAETRLSTKAFGESIPISPNDTDEGKQQNRRVELNLR